MTTAQQAEGRVLVETGTPGWFEDPAAPGKRVRKRDGDRVVTRDEYAQREQARLDAEDGRDQYDEIPGQPASDVPGPEQVADRQQQSEQANGDLREKARQAAVEPETTVLTSGKLVTGQTVEIRDAWVDADKRTDAQRKLFEGDPSKITYDAVVKAAGGNASAMPLGEVRVIKKQDAFQVKFSVANQKRWRNELRRRKNKARRAASNSK